MCFTNQASFEVEIPEDKPLIAFRAWSTSGSEGELRSVWMKNDIEWSGDADKQPTAENANGIHAFGTRQRVQDYISANGGSIIGAVKCFGKITGHGTEGLRAEHAKPVLFDEVSAGNMRWMASDVEYYERHGDENGAKEARERLAQAKNAPKAVAERYGLSVVAGDKLEEAATDHGQLYARYAEAKEAPARHLRRISDEVSRAKVMLARLRMLNEDRKTLVDPMLVPEVPTAEVEAVVTVLSAARDQLQESLNQA